MSDPLFLGDVNNDGRDDLIVQWVNNTTVYRQLLTYNGASDGSFGSGNSSNTNRKHNTSTMSVTQLIGNINGGLGGVDIVMVWAQEASSFTANAYINIGTTDSGFNSNTYHMSLKSSYYFAY